jgi:hypothetical protein
MARLIIQPAPSMRALGCRTGRRRLPARGNRGRPGACTLADGVAADHPGRMRRTGCSILLWWICSIRNCRVRGSVATSSSGRGLSHGGRTVDSGCHLRPVAGMGAGARAMRSLVAFGALPGGIGSKEQWRCCHSGSRQRFVSLESGFGWMWCHRIPGWAVGRFKGAVWVVRVGSG